jgi:exopolysaccharide production protein ExoZ
LAASGVLFYHVLYVLAHRAGYSFQETEVTASGVDLFFVISGFIMFYTTVGQFGRPNASYLFLRRRAIRIVPMYWLCTAIVVLLLAFFPHLFRYSVFEWNTAIPSFFFLLSKNLTGRVGTVLQTGWTLCFEFYFYVIFAILLRWPQKYFLPAAAALFVCGISVGQLRGDIPIWASVATDPLLMEFFAGALIALLFIRGLAMPGVVAAGLIVLGTATIGMSAIWGTNAGAYGVRVLWWGLPSAAILVGAISLERLGIRVPRLLVALGNSSYSLYLTHPFVLPVFGKLGFVWHVSEKVPAVIFGMLAFVTSLFAGHAVYRLVELPLTRYLTTVWRTPVLASSVPAADARGYH